MSNSETLSAHEVAAWLRRHPKFLRQFPDLALSLVVPREDGPAASLAGYQLEVLRDKNRELSRRLHDLFAISQENERLAVRTHQLTLSLMRQKDLEIQAQQMMLEQQRKAQEMESSKSHQLTRQVSTFSQTETELRSQLNQIWLPNPSTRAMFDLSCNLSGEILLTSYSP